MNCMEKYLKNNIRRNNTSYIALATQHEMKNNIK